MARAELPSLKSMFKSEMDPIFALLEMQTDKSVASAWSDFIAKAFGSQEYAAPVCGVEEVSGTRIIDDIKTNKSRYIPRGDEPMVEPVQLHP